MVAAGSLDLAIMLESAKWTDAEAMVRGAAQTLAPNGTPSLGCYSPVCTVIDDHKVNGACNGCSISGVTRQRKSVGHVHGVATDS